MVLAVAVSAPVCVQTQPPKNLQTRKPANPQTCKPANRCFEKWSKEGDGADAPVKSPPGMARVNFTGLQG